MKKNKLFALGLAVVIAAGMLIPSFATDESLLRPSPEGEEAPEVITTPTTPEKVQEAVNNTVEIQDEDIPLVTPEDYMNLDDYAAEIYSGTTGDTETDRLLYLVGDEYIYITPYAERYNISYEGLTADQLSTIADNLDSAYGEINGTDNLGTLLPSLNDLAKSINPDWNSSVFVAADLFDITLSDGYMNALRDNEDYYLHLTFNTNLTADDEKPVVMYRNEETGEWEMVPTDRVTVNDDGTLTVDFYDLGPVALLYTNADNLDPNADLDSGDGDGDGIGCHIISHCHCPWWCPLCPILCVTGFCFCWLPFLIIGVIVAVVLYNVFKEKNDDDEEEENEDGEAHPEGKKH